MRRRAERCVAACYRGSYHAEHSKHTAHNAEPILADKIHNDGRRRMQSVSHGAANLGISRLRSVVEEPHRHRSPNERHESFRNHCAVEDRSAFAFRRKTASHKRTLRGVETADSAAGDGDEQTREDIVGERSRVCSLAHIAHTVPQLGQRRPFYEQHSHQSHSHEQQREREERVYLAYDLVDR